MASKQSIKSKTVKQMQELGVYKPQFDTVIDVFADTVSEYDREMKQFDIEGRQFEVETANGGTKKSGTVSAIENLRKDIIAYSDRLGLTPKSLESLSGGSDQDTGGLLDALKNLSEGLKHE